MNEHDKALHEFEKHINKLQRWFVILPLTLPSFDYSEINLALAKLDQLKKETELAILNDYKNSDV